MIASPARRPITAVGTSICAASSEKVRRRQHARRLVVAGTPHRRHRALDRLQHVGRRRRIGKQLPGALGGEFLRPQPVEILEPLGDRRRQRRALPGAHIPRAGEIKASAATVFGYQRETRGHQPAERMPDEHAAR